MLQYLAEGGIALLDVNPGLMIWTTITFFIVFFVLRSLAWKPISQSLDARADRIHADLDRAENLKKEAEAKFEEYMQKLNSLRGLGSAPDETECRILRISFFKQRDDLLDGPVEIDVVSGFAGKGLQFTDKI